MKPSFKQFLKEFGTNPQNMRQTQSSSNEPDQGTFDHNFDDNQEMPPEDSNQIGSNDPNNGENVDSGNPNLQGMIRKIPRAHLIYKRETDEGAYEELWIYNIQTGMRDEFDIRKKILDGTDIPHNNTQSPDGSQKYNLWTSGNAQLIHITGLPN